MYPYREYFKAKVYTIGVHGPLGLCSFEGSFRPVEATYHCGGAIGTANWEFSKLGGTLFWGPYDKDPTI